MKLFQTMAENNGENEDVQPGKAYDEILEHIWNSGGGLSVTDVKKDFQNPLKECDPSSVPDHLETLRQAGYLKKEGSQYCIDTKAVRYWRGIRHATPKGTFSITNALDNDIIEAKVAEIAERTNERARFLIDIGRIKGAKIPDKIGVYLYCAAGANAVPTDALSEKQVPLHSSAAGRALLAHYFYESHHSTAKPPEDLPSELEHRIELDSSAETERTFSDYHTMSDEVALDDVHLRDEVAYNLDHVDDTSGVHTVAVPVYAGHQIPFGALEVSRPSGDFDDNQCEQIQEILKAAASELSDPVTMYPEV